MWCYAASATASGNAASCVQRQASAGSSIIHLDTRILTRMRSVKHEPGHRSLRGAVPLLATAAVLLAPAAAQATAPPTISTPTPCVAGSCAANVSLTPDPGTATLVEISWRHAGPGDTAFTADTTVLCVPVTLPAPVDTLTGAVLSCSATGPIYQSPGEQTVLVRTTPLGGTPSYTRSEVLVQAKDPPQPDPPKQNPTPRPTARDACLPRRAGEQCGPGNGRRTAGGGAKVSHKGWPALSGILWKVTSSAGHHSKTGGPKNDELLGHHGNDTIRGRSGKDIIWGDWDPSNNGTRQVDRLYGEAGNDWIYSSHGRNTISAGAGRDYIWAYYGRGTIDCGPGFDTLRIRIGAPYRYKNCERIKNFCSFGSKPGNRGGCYKPGERPKGRS